MSDLMHFSRSAQTLARNPLGIIALFIVLIYGFAALTLIVSGSLQPGERIPLVWFLVIFPIIVLATFGWLVSRHHEKLYAPGDYKTDDSFLIAAAARAKHTIELQAQQIELKSKVREVLETYAEGGVVRVEDAMQKVAKEIDRATTISVDTRPFLGSHGEILLFPIAAFESFGELTDEIYFNLGNSVNPYEYGHTWVLKAKHSEASIKSARMIIGALPGRPVLDTRTLSEVGIRPGAELMVERVKSGSVVARSPV